MHIQVGTLRPAWWGQRRMASLLLGHSQSCFFGTDPLTELGVKLTAGSPPFSVLNRTEIKRGCEHG